MTAGHPAVGGAEPALVCGPLPDLPEEDCRSLVVDADLGCHSAMAFRALSWQLFFGGGGGISRVPWLRIIVPCRFALAVVGRGLELHTSSRGYEGATSFLGGLSCKDVCSLIPWCAFMSLDSLDIHGNSSSRMQSIWCTIRLA